MRNLVAKHNHNRAAVHPDRSKKPQKTVDEGLLDYYAENAQDVAQGVYKEACERVVLSRNSDDHVVGMIPDYSYIVPTTLVDIKPVELSEQDKKERILRFEIVFTPQNTALDELMEALAHR